MTCCDPDQVMDLLRRAWELGRTLGRSERVTVPDVLPDGVVRFERRTGPADRRVAR